MNKKELFREKVRIFRRFVVKDQADIYEELESAALEAMSEEGEMYQRYYFDMILKNEPVFVEMGSGEKYKITATQIPKIEETKKKFVFNWKKKKS